MNFVIIFLIISGGIAQAANDTFTCKVLAGPKEKPVNQLPAVAEQSGQILRYGPPVRLVFFLPEYKSEIEARFQDAAIFYRVDLEGKFYGQRRNLAQFHKPIVFDWIPYGAAYIMAISCSFDIENMKGPFGNNLAWSTQIYKQSMLAEELRQAALEHAPKERICFSGAMILSLSEDSRFILLSSRSRLSKSAVAAIKQYDYQLEVIKRQCSNRFGADYEKLRSAGKLVAEALAVVLRDF